MRRDSRQPWMVLLAILTAPATVPGSPGIEAAESAERVDGLAWQIALEAQGFSPGLLDGIVGEKTRLATRIFQASRGIAATGEPCAETRAALEVNRDEAMVDYRIHRDDAAQVRYCPPDWIERSRQPRLLYPTLADCLAERFHTSERCLAALNPGLDLDELTVGTVIRVPLPRHLARPAPARTTRAAAVEIDLSRKLILLLDPRGSVQAAFHCSVARDLDRVRRGAATVERIVEDPNYTFDPASWPEVRNVTRRLLIPPGPRSPVGTRWIGLDAPGVGIHGTPEPENIGKTGSHGCFRLTNWDAAELSRRVSRGTPVWIVDRSATLDRLLGESIGPGPEAPGRRLEAAAVDFPRPRTP